MILVRHARLVGSPGKSSRNIVDIAAAGLVVDHAAHRERVGDQRQVDRGVDIAAGIAVRGGGVAGIEIRFGHIELRLVGDVADHTRLSAGAEQGALRTLEHLDALDVGRINVEVPARQLPGLLVQIHGDIGKTADDAGPLERADGRCQPAHVNVVLAGAEALRRHIGQILHEVVEGRYVELGERLGGHCLNGDGHILHVFRAALGGHGNFLKPFRLGGFDRRGGVDHSHSGAAQNRGNRVRQLLA